MISGTTGATSASGSFTQSASGNQLGKDAFLRLLVAQLRSQDPMQPMEDKEFISQLAQFSSLEQMQLVNKNLEGLSQAQSSFQQGVALVGKTVEIINPDYDPESDPKSAATITGKVESVDLRYDTPLLKVGNKQIPLGFVLVVS